jgi:F-type H+-transporting ATPase subunit epsilon
MHLQVVTPQGAKLETNVSAVTAPGTMGDMGILPGHQPLLTSLGIGALSYTADGQTGWLAVNGGFLEVADDALIVITETAEAPSEIDVDRAKRAQASAGAASMATAASCCSPPSAPVASQSTLPIRQFPSKMAPRSTTRAGLMILPITWAGA